MCLYPFQLAKGFPTPPATAGIVWSDDWGQLSEEALLRDFAGDLPAEKARVLSAVQVRLEPKIRVVTDIPRNDHCD